MKMKNLNQLEAHCKAIMVGVMILVGLIAFFLSSVSAVSYSANNLYQDCYQNQANISTSCGGLATGSYQGGNDAGNLSIDGNWNTYGNYGFSAITVNYSKPLNATGATWIAKDTNNFNVISIRDTTNSCWDTYSSLIQLQFKYPTFRGTSYYCKEGSAFHTLLLGEASDFNNTYEEGVSWIMNDTSSLTTENLSSSSSQNIFVRYLKVPQNVFITNAFLNMTYTSNYGNLVSFFKFNNGSGTAAFDEIRGNNYQFNSAPTWQTSSFGAGFINQSRGIDDTTWIDTNLKQNGSNNLTVIIKINNSLPLVGKDSYVMSDGATGAGCDASNIGFLLDESNAGAISFTICNGTTTASISSTGLQNNSNYFIALVMSPPNCNFYLNGVSNPFSCFGWNGLSSFNLTLFNRPQSKFDKAFRGSIDQFAVYNRALTQAEIIAINSSTSENEIPDYSIPNNIVQLSVGDSQFGSTIFNFTNSKQQKTSNLASSINYYLETCEYVNGNCSVPIGFSFENATLNYNSMSFNNFGSIVTEYNDSGPTYETAMASFNITIIYDKTRYPLILPQFFYCDVIPCRLYTPNVNTLTNGSFLNITIALPAINETRQVPYFWEWSLSNGTTELSDVWGLSGPNSFLNISVVSYPFYVGDDTGNCDGIDTAMTSISVHDELVPSLKIEPFSFYGTFHIWLGDGTQYKNYSKQTNNASDLAICVSDPLTDSFFDAEIQYSDVNATNYNPRNYYFDNQSSFAFNLNPISFYLLNKTIATSFIETVFDKDNLPFVGGLIYSNRWYPGEGIYRTVEISRTDTSGSTVAQFQTETPYYQFNITRDTILYLSTINQKIVPTAVPYTLTFFIGQNLQAPWGDFLNKSGFSYSGPTLDNNTKIISFSYTDTSSITKYVRMVVSLINETSDNNIICDVNSTLSIGTLTCDTSGYNGTVQASVFLSRSPQTPIITTIIILSNAIRDAFGRMGYFLGWLIIVTGFMIAVYNPTAGIVTGNVACWVVWGTGMISFGLVWLIGLLALSIWVIAELNT